MANANQVIVKGETILDLRSDTVTPETLQKGYTAHDKSGTKITGTLETSSGGVNVSYNTVEPNRYDVDLDNYTAQLDLTGLVAGSHYICVMYFNGRALDGQNMSIMEYTARYTISVFSTGSEQNDGVTYSILSYGSGDCSTQYNSPLVLNLGQLLDSTKNSTAYGMAYNIIEMTGSMIVSWD